MREAFPSLPFGSPSVEKECRDKDNTAGGTALPIIPPTTETSSEQTDQAGKTHDFPIQATEIATGWTCVSIHPSDLEELQTVLHFPEEVALRLTDTEYQIFYKVPAVNFFKHVILELQEASTSRRSGDNYDYTTIFTLQKRFDEVCAWVTYLVLTQPTNEDRKSIFSCLLRTALACWNIGNFNGAMEITTGLRSVQLKPFLITFSENGKIPTLDFLSAAIDSAEYERALTRGLSMSECRVVPCYKMFLKELKDIMASCQFNIFIDSSSLDPHTADKDDYTKQYSRSSFSAVIDAVKKGIQTNFQSGIRKEVRNLTRPVYVSEYNDGDQNFKKICSSGVINIDQIYKIQAVMDHIDLCHQHHHSLIRESPSSVFDYLRTASLMPRHQATIHHSEIEELEEDYEVEIGNYNPVQPMVNDHGVSMIPISSSQQKIDHHILQILHHGTTAILWDPELIAERSCYVYLRLERSCSMITWHKPSWRRLKTYQDFDLTINPEETLSQRVSCRPQINVNEFDGQSTTLDEGSLDLSTVKEISIGSRNNEYNGELLAAGKRFGLTHIESCLSILYGSVLSENRVLSILCPPMLYRVWYVGLNNIIKCIRRQHKLSDRSISWLKEQYINLYFEDSKCSEPLVAHAIRVFGGRDWINNTVPSQQHQSNDVPSLFQRENSVKFKKKRSVVNLLTAASSTIDVEANERDINVKGADAKKESLNSYGYFWKNSNQLGLGTITYESQLDFLDFVALFRSFSLLARKDLRDLFDQLSVTRKSKTKLTPEKSRSTPELCTINGLLTRNASIDAEFTDAQYAKKKCFDALAASTILTNCVNIDTTDTQIITCATLKKFLESRQMEIKNEEDVNLIIKRHEPDRTLRIEGCMSFEGFARYMMDKDNNAFINENVIKSTMNMDQPLSQYYVASSHNTYLTGHQLKGESSSELYSQVLLNGCRCVELDCWDGDDGFPVIYHGHTFTTKISFKSVVDAINKTAFITSPYPVILSIENHCSLQQQTKMAHIFQTVFGEKLITKFISETDYNDEAMLPSPSKLKNKILIKNKKITMDVPYTITGQSTKNSQFKHQTSQPGRTSSIISSVSGGSITEEYSDDDYDEDDDDDNIDDKTLNAMYGSTDEKSTKYNVSSFSMPIRKCDFEEKPKKRGNQISRDLSDMVIYLQAIKFRGLNSINPQHILHHTPNKEISCNNLATAGSMLKQNAMSTASVRAQIECGSPIIKNALSTDTDLQSSNRKAHQPNINNTCYQCSSVNEASAKKLCRKHPLTLIAHTESQLLRTYPAGLRIDSSNFNPIFFWAFGIQMVALNYQTDDQSMHINTAMFEDNGGCGFVCKPEVLWNPTHLMYRRFNPLEKEFDGLHSSHILINVVSGQYVFPSNLFAPTYVEVEMLGIPVDCSKKRSRIVKRNALNPIWNDTFYFKIMFYDLTFLRFSVYDAESNHLVSQRVIPLKCLRPGYRHVRLRSPINQPLSMASLFIYSRVEEESMERLSEESDDIGHTQEDLDSMENLNSVDIQTISMPLIGANIPLKRRMFFLMVYGVVTDEPYTILKITQESITQEVILQALQKSNRVNQNVNDYILVEEVKRGWEKRDRDLPPTQRVLDIFEKPLQAQAFWKGDGRFILKRIGDDPSSRAWLTSIRSVSERRSIISDTNEESSFWSDAECFLVCVYNVSPDIPYAILKVPINATAQDVLAQSLVKARRMENPNKFILLEELEFGSSVLSSSNIQQRPLGDEENVYSTQANWKTIGRFILQEKQQITPSMRRHRIAIEKISRGFSINRNMSHSTTIKAPIQVAVSDPTAFRTKSRSYEASSHSQMGRGIFRSKGNSEKETPTCSPRQKQREVHSEGETLSDDELKERDLMTTVYRIKKISMKKLKAWKS